MINIAKDSKVLSEAELRAMGEACGGMLRLSQTQMAHPGTMNKADRRLWNRFENLCKNYGWLPEGYYGGHPGAESAPEDADQGADSAP